MWLCMSGGEQQWRRRQFPLSTPPPFSRSSVSTSLIYPVIFPPFPSLPHFSVRVSDTTFLTRLLRGLPSPPLPSPHFPFSFELRQRGETGKQPQGGGREAIKMGFSRLKITAYVRWRCCMGEQIVLVWATMRPFGERGRVSLGPSSLSK